MAGNSRNNKVPVQQQQRMQGPRMRTTAIPSRTTYAIDNRAPNRAIIERAMELLDPISISSSTPVGTSWTFELNPLQLEGTRLQTLARNYQQFKFRKAKLIFGNNVSTSTNGAIVGAYLSNPDQELPDNPVRALFGAGGSSAPVWQPLSIEAKLLGRGPVNDYFNIDADSREVMLITQGKFVLALQGQLSSTTNIDFPIYLDYEIEFKGAAIQKVISTGQDQQIYGAGIVNKSATTNAYSYTVNASENLPTLSLHKPYILTFAIGLQNIAGEEEDAYVFYPTFTGTGYYGGLWYKTPEDLKSNNFIVPPTSAWETPVPRNIISSFSLN